MKFFAALIIIAVGLAAIVGPQALFSVDETQFAIVLRFGEAKRVIEDPGLHLKTPFIETVNYLDNRLLVFDAPPDSLLTKDKRNLVIDVYARGRIVDPRKFIEEVATERGGANRAIEIVASELRREVALDDQSEIIKTSREQVMNSVRDAVRPKLDEFGIQLLDVRIKRADFPSAIANSVYLRMKAERKRKADRERAAGAKADREIKADVDRQATIIRSTAQKDADIIRGCGDAEAIRIFAEAVQQDPEFYTFQRSLTAARNYLPQNTVVYGSAEEWGSILEEVRQAAAKAALPPDSADSATVASGDGSESICAELEVQLTARRLLGSELGISGSALVVKSIEAKDWPNTSLGCPEEDKQYAQVITPGYRVAFEYEGTLYTMHSNQDGSQVVNCTPQETTEGAGEES